MVYPLSAEEATIAPTHPHRSRTSPIRYLKPSRLAGTSLEVKGPARVINIQDLCEGEYHYNLSPTENRDGVRWIVIKGRQPGVFQSWFVHSIWFHLLSFLIPYRPDAHRQVHGLDNPQEAYKKIENYMIAIGTFEVCAHKGFVEIALANQWPRYLYDEVLEACTKCLCEKDKD